MKALILCAGYGTRLGKLAEETPKPMIKIGKYPVLEHLVYHLSKFGIKQIMINLHHKPDVFMNYFGTRLLYSYEHELLGEEGTIDSLGTWLNSDYTVVMNGDTLTNIDISDMFRLSKGENIRSMDGDIYTGCKIINPEYFSGDKSFIDYRCADLYWQDMGTPEGLEKAKRNYEKFGYLSGLSS